MNTPNHPTKYFCVACEEFVYDGELATHAETYHDTVSTRYVPKGHARYGCSNCGQELQFVDLPYHTYEHHPEAEPDVYPLPEPVGDSI